MFFEEEKCCFCVRKILRWNFEIGVKQRKRFKIFKNFQNERGTFFLFVFNLKKKIFENK